MLSALSAQSYLILGADLKPGPNCKGLFITVDYVSSYRSSSW